MQRNGSKQFCYANLRGEKKTFQLDGLPKAVVLTLSFNPSHPSSLLQDKDAKIAFLQKALDVVMLVIGEPLSAKPARIVAGHEPERTNELLQAIAKCCLNKVCLLGKTHVHVQWS